MATRAIGTAGVEGAIVEIRAAGIGQQPHAVGDGIAVGRANARGAFAVQKGARGIVRCRGRARAIRLARRGHAIRKGRAESGIDRGAAIATLKTQAQATAKGRASGVVG